MSQYTRQIIERAVFETLEGRQLFASVTVSPADAAVSPAVVHLTGTQFGTAGSWLNSGNTFDKALDGNPATYFDSAVGNDNVVGLDLGTPQIVTSIRLYPRAGLAWRMNGGKFQGSNDGTTWTDLYTLTSDPASGTYTTVNLTSTAAYRYVRYHSPNDGFGNVAEIEFYGTPALPTAPTSLTAAAQGTSSVSLAWQDNSTNETGFKIERSTDGVNFTLVGSVTANVTAYTDTTVAAGTAYTYRVRATNDAGDSAACGAATVTTPTPPPVVTPALLTGTAFGTAGSWNNNGNTFDKALDNNPSTFFDSNQGTGAVVGLDFGSARTITQVRVTPRWNFGSRMVGGVFQGSNDNSTWTTLATVTTAPPNGQYTALAVTDPGSYRYVRYVSPADGYGNVADIAFYGTTPTSGQVGNGPGTGNSSGSGGVVVTPAPAAPTGLTTAVTSAGTVSLSWVDNATNETVFNIERSIAGGTWQQLATVSANTTTYTDTTVAEGTTYSYRVRATNEGGDSARSNEATATTPRLSPQPVLTLLENSVTAGMAIHGSAIGTVLNSGSPITARYEWDFGDPNGKYNQLTGFTASHAYDTPGTYTVTLKVTDETGRSTTTTQTVTVAADTRRTIYVDSVNGSDSNDGSSPTKAVKTATYAFKLLGNNTKILFNRGETFGVTASLGVPYTNVTVGAYGTGANPVLLWQGGTQSWWEMISPSATATRDLMVENLTFDSASGTPNGIAPRGMNVTIRNCEFHNLSEAINCAGNPNGLLVQDNVQPQNSGVADYFMWIQGTNITVLGNNVGGGGMYAIRASGVNGTYTGVLLAYNTLSNDQRSNLRMQKGSYVYVTNNTFNTSGVEFGPLGEGDGFDDPDYKTVRTSYVVFENNTMNLDQKYLRISHGAEHVMIRNNVINRTSSTGGEAISIGGYDPSFTRQVSDLYIENNTIVDNDTIGIAIKLVAPEQDPEITILNNLFVAPNLVASAATGSADLWITDSTMGSIRLISGNIWSAPKYDNYVGKSASVFVTGATTTGFITPTVWDSYSNVEGDIFQNVTLGSVYQVTLNGVTAGASLAKS